MEIDFDRLAKRLDNDKELLIAVVGAFLGTYQENLSKIRSSAAEKDAAALEDASHAIKGALQSLGLDGAAGLAYKLEELGREGDFSGSDEVLNDLERNIEGVVPALKEYVGSE